MTSARFTIGQAMVVIAALAGLLAVPRIAMSTERVVLECFIGLFMVLALLNALVEAMLGKRCPLCSRFALLRLARHRRYYRCSACRGRFKRSGFGPWLDASGPEDADRYRPRKEAGQWKGFSAPGELGTSTSGRLLRSKRTLDLDQEAKRRSHPPTRHQRLESAERKAREALLNLHEWQEGIGSQQTAL